MDLPADLITDTAESPDDIEQGRVIHPPPTSSADKARLFQNFSAYQDHEGASGSYWEGRSYARAEGIIRELDDKTQIPFFPSPMDKGVLPDSHLQNTSSARSTALQLADIILILGA